MDDVTRPVDAPKVQVRYDDKDITADITPFLQEAIYTDNLTGEADTLELLLEDVDGRWLSAWYPEHGDTITATGTMGEQAALSMGSFEIDEIELNGPPDMVAIKCVSAGVKKPVRTRNGRAYSNTTLADIAKEVAQRNKLKLSGKIEHIHINRAMQVFETDLVFLHRLADEYGYSFNVRDKKLVFYRAKDLRDSKPVYVITKLDCCSSYRLRDKVKGVVGEAEVSYLDPRTKKHRTVKVKDGKSKHNRASADRARINVRAENDSQAKHKAQALLDKNDEQTGASLVLYGNTLLVAGVTVELQTFGTFDGKYLITKSIHRFTQGGYVVEVELKRVRT